MSNAILQRFDRLEQKTTKNFEVVTDEIGNQIIFRQTPQVVKDKRGCNVLLTGFLCLWANLAALMISPSLIWLAPFTIVICWLRFRRKDAIVQEQETYFAIDTQARKIFIPIVPYKKQTHSELHLDHIRYFYSWLVDYEESVQWSVRCTYGKNEEVVEILNIYQEFDTDQCARLLGFLCDKEVYKRNTVGNIYPLPPTLH